MKDKSFLSMIKRNIMTVILVLVYLFFVVLTKGGIFKPASFSELVNQNAYVYILGVGMLMCMLTGGNVDLSCGSFVCLLGALGGLFMVIKGMNVVLSIVLILVMLATNNPFLKNLVSGIFHKEKQEKKEGEAA